MTRLSPTEHRRIVVAVSSSEESMHATGVAAHLEVPLEFTLEAKAPPEEAARRRSGQELLSRCQALAERYGVSSRRVLARRHAAGPAIVDAAEHCGASMIVIAGEQRFARSGRVRLGATPTYVLKHADCRVLLLAAGIKAAGALAEVA
jgi:nucleotide-binding universal stress UspA family protein